MNKFMYFLFGEVDSKAIPDLALTLAFFIALFSATCFFFDAKLIIVMGYPVHFPVGLIFFPLTYVISNIFQFRSGRKVANTMVACCFMADLFLVIMGWIIANIGDRKDFYTVFNEIPIIMGATFVFLTISSIFNSFVFDKLLVWLRNKGSVGLFVAFFSSITAAELLVSSMSMPLLFYRRGFNGGVYITILTTVLYKVLFNLIASVGYVVYDSLKKDSETAGYNLNVTKVGQSTINTEIISS